MATTPKLSKEFSLIFDGTAIAKATDFSLTINKENIDITTLDSAGWKEKLVDLKEWAVSFSGLVVRGSKVGLINWLVGSTYGDTDLVIYTDVAQVETITLEGGSGTADVTLCGGLTKTATWNTSLTQTAADFVTDHAAAYLAVGVVVTSSGVDIIFTAATAGTPIIAPAITNTGGDLDGTVVHTTANQTGNNFIYISQQAANTGHNPSTDDGTWWKKYFIGFAQLLTQLVDSDETIAFALSTLLVDDVYQYGDGYITSLEPSGSVGDKVTYSGTIEGTTELHYATIT